jgi:putative heme iron utilization protein
MMDIAQAFVVLEALTNEMVAAAEAQDFEKLTDLSEQFGPLATIVLKAEVLPDFAERARAILRNQERIYDLTSPWLEATRTLLKDNRRQQAVVSTYLKTP